MNAPVFLACQPPFDWARLLGFFGARAIDGVESVAGDVYRRSVCIHRQGKDHAGWLTLAPARQKNRLTLELSPSLVPVQDEVVRRIRQQFDLDAQPDTFLPVLGKLAKNCTGVRVPGAFDGMETATRAILGQQVTVAAASTLAGRLATALGTPVATPFAELTRVFPSATTLAQASEDTLGRLGVVRTRTAAIRALAQGSLDGSLPLVPLADADVAAAMRAFLAVRGIGDWTTNYLAMRVLGWRDAFPAADYGVMKALGVDTPKAARVVADAWRPFRAYAVMCLWHSLAE